MQQNIVPVIAPTPPNVVSCADVSKQDDAAEKFVPASLLGNV